MYFPKHTDTSLKFPIIILFHPGGFEFCSSYDQFEIQYICREFARRGFCVATVEYRRGRIIDPNRIYIYVQQELAFYRVMQDCRGAIRSIIQRQRDRSTINKYQIDTTNMFLCGMSAGGVGTITAALYSDSMVYGI